MGWNKFTLLIPYLLALAITTSVFVYAWQHRHIRGGNAYTWYVGGQTLWAIGYVFELLVPGIEGKIFWDSVQWIAGFFIVIAFPLFAVQYTGFKIKYPGLVWGVTSIVPVVMTAIVLTDNQHHLIYSNPSLMFDSIYPELHYDFTWVVYGYAVYSYLVTFTGLVLLIRRMFRPHRLYTRQIMTVTLGFFIPIFFTILTTVGVEFAPFRDVSILTFALGNLIIAAGLFRFKLFEVVPIARELVVESMEDLVVVLDMQDRIVDMNPPALHTLETKSSQVIGQTAATVFASWPELVNKFFEPENVKSEISIDSYHFEIKSTLLNDKNDRYIGRVFVARDITERKELQEGLEKLNQELEERVAKRTEELYKSEERYRAVVEHQTELITRWKPDRTRTFVNDAYCRYFGLTTEQALETDFMSLIVEEDRPAKQEKISRLEEGLVDNDVDIQRVYRPDGSIGWQEWVDTAIRDENGKIIEFQSVGRDITERKRAEEALRISEDRYRRLAENAPDIIFRYILSPAPKLEYINPAVEKITGYPPEECYADPLLMLNMAHPDDAHKMAELMQSLGPLNEPITMRWIGKDGTIRWMESRLVPVNDETGQLVAVEGLTRDITERKRTEDEIRKLSHAVEQSNASIVITDSVGKIEYVNPYFSELTGYTLEEVIGQKPSILQSGFTDKSVYEDLWKTITAGKEWQGEFCNQKKNGELYWESASISPIVDNSGVTTHFVAVKTDTTERKRTEETVLKQLAFEELMTVILTNFATCSHDEIDACIQDALQKISAFMEIERSYLIIAKLEHQKTWSTIYEWCAPHMESRLTERQDIPFGTLPWSEKNLLEGNVNRINTLDEYPPEAYAEQQFNKAEGVQSILDVPIRGASETISGCIGVNMHSRSVNWTDDDVSHLKIVGDAIANLLERKRAEESLLKAYDTTLEGWAKALELRDKETEDHSRRVTELTVILAQAMGIEGDELIHIRRGAILHDIGKMAIPDEILRKRGTLTDAERKVVEQHPIRSYELLSSIAFLEKAIEIPYCHHEHWDGSGYPRGLKGEEIPLAARIFTVVDVWDALLSDRPYSKAWTREKAIQYLKDESGKIFDPECDSVFLELVEQGKI